MEVLSKASASGSWLCAEIISRRHHTYSLKYGWGAATNEGVVHRVPRKAIRPCPPPVEGTGNWLPGDLVEAFDNPYWKTVVVVKVLDGNCFLVRFVGSVGEFIIHKSFLRARQCWEDGTWFILGEGKRLNATRVKLLVGDGEVEKCRTVSSRSLKRRRSADLLECEGHAAKIIRLIGKDNCSKRSVVLNPSPVSEKVDVFVSQNNVLGKNDLDASFHGRTAKYTCVDIARAKGRHSVETSLITDTASCQSSVASCSSIMNDTNKFPSCSRVNNSVDLDYSSDAESHCGRKQVEEAPVPSIIVDSRTDNSRSELHAYRCALWALYASGPTMSWEEEEKLTDLRCKLNISNDEHKMELGNLLCAHSRLPLNC